LDDGKGEIICSNCGKVVESDMKDLGPDWRSFNDDEQDSRRGGPPIDPLKYDRGLTTNINRKLKDGKGNQLSPKQRKKAFKLRRAERRNKKKDAKERSLSFAIIEIRKLASALNLPRRVSEKSANLYRRASKENLIRGRSREGVATATVYASCRMLEVPRTMEEIAEVSSIDRKEMRRSFLSLSRNLDLDIPPVSPASLISRYASELGLSSDTKQTAYKILERSQEKNLVTGRNPRGIVGAILYLAAKQNDEEQTQRNVAEKVNITEVTIRNRFREIGRELDIDY
jgi:transcription initiation factor TFIIB